MPDTTMGQRIAECRKKLNLSQESLGDKMGVSRQAISKWESDGAVPEIDKLIALSRLFNVSVGWLLGVEKAEPQKPDELTDTQLKMVEEIVKRYHLTAVQEEKKPRLLWPKILGAAAVIMILLAALSNLNRQLSWNANSISGLNSNYSSIQNQLSILASRLDELAAGEKLLSEYSVEAEAWEDGKGAILSFTLTPKSWNENDTAYVAVRCAGAEVERFECHWDGTACKAPVSVPARNDYEYYYIVRHADNTQEQELISSTGYEDVARALEGIYSITCQDAQISNGYLIFSGFSLDVEMPAIPRTDTVYMEGMEWVLFVNGEEYYREDLLLYYEWDHMTNLQGSGSGLNKFSLPRTASGDTVLLSVEIQLSDGTQKLVDVAQFRLENGTWLQADFSPA